MLGQAKYLVIASALALATPARAHDHWLTLARTGTATTLRHFVGAGLVPELSRAWEPDKASRAELIGPSSTVDLRARYPAAPALVLPPLGPGTWLLLLDRRPTTITLSPQEFAAYLAEEGIDRDLARRGIRVDPARPARERYARYLKAIVGGADAARLAEVRGQRLELTPLEAIGRVGTRLPLRVTLDGRPLPRAPLFAEVRASGRLEQQRLETAEDGTTVVSLSAPGLWLVHLVHMERCARDCAALDWESAWGALTFEVAR